MGHFYPADHSKGDANTLGGYAVVHARPAAFEGSDGMSYSVEICVDETGEGGRPYGAFLLFLRWRRIGGQGVEGHLETDFLEYGSTEEEARAGVGRMRLSEVRDALEALIRDRHGDTPPPRRWWDVMREADDA